ncbi:hypothetical protein MRX96_009088 [Rhipicephalus microplus]
MFLVRGRGHAAPPYESGKAKYFMILDRTTPRGSPADIQALIIDATPASYRARTTDASAERTGDPSPTQRWTLPTTKCQAILPHACCQQESVGVLVLSCCVFELDAAEPPTDSSDRKALAALRACSVRQTRRSNIPCTSARGYSDICRRLFNAYAQLTLPHVSPEHLLFPSANVATLRRAFHVLLDFFGDADLFTRL